MLTDLGGFVASTFKRGIKFVNIPTTLLSMVDASVGGKTGFNLGECKNEIGTFSNPQCVILDTSFLATLDHSNIRSGYAEMIKHALISSDDMLEEILRYDLSDIDYTDLAHMIQQSVAVKERIVSQDPQERGIRKALNLGHTIGHAIESLSLQTPKPLLHGYAVAYGIVAELYLSVVKCGFPIDKLRSVVRYIHKYYGQSGITCDDYNSLIALMQHDKKNTADTINFTLLSDIGNININQTATESEIFEALDFLRDGQ